MVSWGGVGAEGVQLGPSHPLYPTSWLPGDLMTCDIGMTQNCRNGMAASLHIHPGIRPMVRTKGPMLGLMVRGEIR